MRVARGSDVRVGDVVITSGLGGVYPKGLRIGEVKELADPGGGLLQTATLQPAVDFGRLEHVVKALAAEYAALVERHAALRADHDALVQKLGEVTINGRALEERLRAENQRRQDALKRIDELIGRIGLHASSGSDLAAPDS